MVDKHLSKNEAADVFRELKRKVWTCVDERRVLTAKRHKTGAASDEVRVVAEIETDRPQLSADTEEHVLPTSVNLVTAEDNPSAPPGELGLQKPLIQTDEDQVIEMLDVDDTAAVCQMPPSRDEVSLPTSVTRPMEAVPRSRLSFTPEQGQPQIPSLGRSSYTVPSSSDSGEEETPTPAPHHRTSGCGLDHEDEELYSPDSLPPVTAKVLLNKQQQSRTKLISTCEYATVGHSPRS